MGMIPPKLMRAEGWPYSQIKGLYRHSDYCHMRPMCSGLQSRYIGIGTRVISLPTFSDTLSVGVVKMAVATAIYGIVPTHFKNASYAPEILMVVATTLIEVYVNNLPPSLAWCFNYH